MDQGHGIDDGIPDTTARLLCALRDVVGDNPPSAEALERARRTLNEVERELEPQFRAALREWVGKVRG